MSTKESKEPILFPIELLDYDICRTCPEMEIEVNRLEIFSADKKFYENRLKCEHHERCRHLMDGYA